MSSLLQHKNIKKTSHIINMTREPFRLYEDLSGKIVTFFPNMRAFCHMKSWELFPEDAYYVFSRDMVEGAYLLKNNHRKVAFIDGKMVARDGIVIVRLASLECHQDVRFFKRGY